MTQTVEEKSTPSIGQYLWPVWLVPGVTRANGLALYFGAFMTMGLLVFVAVATPFVMNIYLNIPLSEQGRVAGDLAVWNEITLLLVFPLFGIMADRMGRRQLYGFGLVVMALAYYLYPTATGITELTVYRVIYAVGIGAATAMLGTIVADYPQEKSRGKLVATIGVLNGIGILLISVAMGGHLAEFFVERGADEFVAGRYKHTIIAVLCLITAVVVATGLKKGTPAPRESRPSLWELAWAGFGEARNPRVALSYAAGFIARSDLVLVGTFTVLWGTTAAISQGLGEVEAVKKGAIIFGVVQGAALVWMPVMGWMLDRMNRVTGMIVSMGLTGLGFLSVWFVDDPLSAESRLFFIFLGIGQASAFMGATTLLGQEAPMAKRGVVVGMFNIMGAIGIFFSTGIGGRLFDAVKPAAPFALIGALSLMVMVAAIVIRFVSPGPQHSEIKSGASIGH